MRRSPVKVLRLVAVAAAAAMIMAACGGESDGGTLEDTSWIVDRLQGADGSLESPVADTVLSAEFSTDVVSGFSGCNSYMGSFATDGNSFSAGPIAGTLRLCDPPAVSQQESRFLMLLESADRWRRDRDQLELRSGSDVLIAFSAATPPQLAGSSWTLLGYNNQADAIVSTTLDTEVTMMFDDTTASGSAGCNGYNSQYETSETALTFGAVASTRRICADPPGIMEQESLVLSNLELVRTFAVTEQGILEMYDESGTRLLRFLPAE